MARPLRIEFAGAIYHAMSRGNARQRLFRDERDYGRFFEGLEATVDKFEFELFSFVCMPNHVHLFLRTPRPNLSKGMQYLLSGYANWFNTRHRCLGHLFQGRFKGELIEDETYFWNVSRYIHGRLTVATLRELMEPFGLSHPDSVRNLIRRADQAMAESPEFRQEMTRLKQKLQPRSSAK